MKLQLSSLVMRAPATFIVPRMLRVSDIDTKGPKTIKQFVYLINQICGGWGELLLVRINKPVKGY